jgi:hypothetical protein
LRQNTIHIIEAYDAVGHHQACTLEEDAGLKATEPVVTKIDLGGEFHAASVRTVIDKINRNQKPDPHSLIEQALHLRLMRALQTTDLYAGMTFIGYRVPEEPSTDHIETEHTSANLVAA